MTWTECNIGSENLQTYLNIIDDALIYLFEFKVENHKLYYRELESYPQSYVDNVDKLSTVSTK